MSNYDEVDDPVQKVIDEFGRHRLTDVLEEENEDDQSSRPWNGPVSRKRYSSSSQTSSLDALWDLVPHRLSEAGLSRHSDSSTILTEDTDSFIIGQRVWVGGTKPGHIAYIGETQFAPGEWAGIALDEPIGKNDGSVGGIHYFQCEPKKGVFARLTRLSRVPLSQDHVGSGESLSLNSPLNGSTRKSSITPSPTEGHRSMSKSPGSVSASNISLSSVHVDYRIGDRVIIKSSQGSKVGTVRFMGLTEFAPGEWVGVELDEHRGKNDGSVNGIRYFECQPNFGIFSPISKVSKSPSKVKPGQCQVHPSSGGLPPSGLKRSNSKESMSSNLSMMSSASTAARRVRLGVNSLTPKKIPLKSSPTTVPTRTALQDVLKEKQQHIEQLLKERDLERAEITRAASQAEEAEQKYTQLRQEYDKYRAESEVQLKELIDLLNKLKENRNELVSELEDEKRKNEDWQFKFEEAEITRVDFEALNKEHSLKIKELESLLAFEREKVENLEADSQKLFEADENLMKAKEEIDSLRKELQDTKNRKVALEGETVTTTVLIKSLQDDLDQSRKECDEKSEIISVLKHEINVLSSDRDSLRNQVESINMKISQIEEKCVEKDKEKEIIQLELDNANKIVIERNKAIEKLQAENLNIENVSQKECDKLKMELSAKINDLESLNEKLDSTEALLQDLKRKFEETSTTLESKNKELLQYQNRSGDLETNLRDEINKLQIELKNRIEEQTNLEKNLTMKLSEKEAELHKCIELNDENTKVISNLNIEIENLKKSFENNQKEAQEAHKKEIESLKAEIAKLISENNEISSNLGVQSADRDKIIGELTAKLSESDRMIEQLNRDIEKLRITSEENYRILRDELNQQIQLGKSEIEKLNLEIQEQTNKNKTQQENLNYHMSSLEEKKSEMDILSGKYNDLKDMLEEQLQLKTEELQNAFREIDDKSKLVDSLETELKKTKLDLERVTKDLSQYQINIGDIEHQLRKERDELHESLKSKINEMDDLRKNLSGIISQKDATLVELNFKLAKQSEEIEHLKNNTEEIKDGHEKKMNELVECQKAELIKKDESLSEIKMEIDKKNIEIQKLNLNISSLTEKNIEYEKMENEIESLKKQIVNDNQTIQNLNEEINNLTKLKVDLETSNNDLKELKHLIEINKIQYENDISTKELEVKEVIRNVESKDCQINELNLELNKLKEQYTSLTEEVVKYESNLSDVENSLRKEKNDISAELDAKTSQLNNTEIELNQVKLNHDQMVKDFENIRKERDTMREILEVKSKELDKVKKELEQTNNNLEDEYKEKNRLKQELVTVTSEMNNKNIELEKILMELPDVKSLENKFEQIYEVLSQKCEHFKKKTENVILMVEEHKKHVNDVIESHKIKLSQNMKKSSDLEKTIESKNEELANLVRDLDQRESLLRIKEEEIVKLGEKILNLEEELKSDVLKGKENIEIVEKERTENKSKMELLEKDLSKITSEKDTLLKKVHDLNIQIGESEKLKQIRIEKEQSLESVKSEFDKVKIMNEKLIAEQKKQIEATELSENRLKTIVAEMQTDSQGVSDLKTNLKNLEKRISEKDAAISDRDAEIRKLKDLLNQQQSKPNLGEISSNGLLEEKISAENQVAFLNSIIVDMQKKTEEQKHRIEILEMGYSPAAAEELNQLGFKTDFTRQPAPRMYCDICEEFDLHETEDCPTQSSDGFPIHNPLNKEKKEKPPPRSYCDICGEFGHETENCTDDQEF